MRPMTAEESVDEKWPIMSKGWRDEFKRRQRQFIRFGMDCQFEYVLVRHNSRSFITYCITWSGFGELEAIWWSTFTYNYLRWQCVFYASYLHTAAVVVALHCILTIIFVCVVIHVYSKSNEFTHTQTYKRERNWSIIQKKRERER